MKKVSTEQSVERTARARRTEHRRVLVLGVYLALGVGLVLHLLHVGQHEAHEVGALFHWLRDSVMAIPLAGAAVFLGTFLVDPRRPERAARILWAFVTSLIYALVTIPGNLAHAALFGAEHAHSGGVVAHLLRDASIAFVPALLLLSVAAFVAVLPGEGRHRGSATRSEQLAAVAFHHPVPLGRRVWLAVLSGAMVAALLPALPFSRPFPQAAPADAQTGPTCRQISADVVAIDQPFVYNRLGAANPNGLIYALRHDVVDKTTGLSEADGATLTFGNVMLRPDKRPRPLVLRANVGDCITINFQNLLENPPLADAVEFPGGGPGFSPANGQFEEWPTDRHVGIHVNGMQLVDSINSDGSFVGKNGLDEAGNVLDTSGLAAPGESKVYQLFAEYENGYLMYNLGATVGSEGTGGTTGLGLFGAINVEPVTSEWYRSQLTRLEMDMAASAWIHNLVDDTWSATAEPQAEQFTDVNGNGVWDEGVPAEPLLTDENGDGVWDDVIPADTYTDTNDNGVWDEGVPAEPLLTDENGDGVWDEAIPADTYDDTNGNEVWDDAIPADTYDDTSGDGIWQPGEELLTDENGDGVWDEGVPAEPLLTDTNGDGVWDDAIPADTYDDTNGNEVWDEGVPAEPLLTDANGDGVWDDAIAADTFTDENGNLVWDNGIEPLDDMNGNGAWDELAVRTTPDGQPILNYDAVYPAGTGLGKDGLPIIAILNGTEVVHSDLNAIISGPAGSGYKIPKEAYSAGYWENANYPGGDDPFREFTVIFEDEAFAVQAFPQFTDPVLAHTLNGVQDAFPINYGTGGIGSEIIANRVGLGPMANCVECKYEEFFLTAWTVGDPAMVVDVPANVNVNGDGSVVANPVRATKALYPDDPSNVHHSYLNDRVKFRNLHAGVKEQHIFHLHAHQWQYDWNSETSTYLDSQGIGPGAAFTYEIAYGGSGNRNKTVGDSIFHCHFYPHFAMGMWELWRSHDVFERGTLLDGDGTPADGARALPDGEIIEGTPIPGVVPLPSIPMAPSPAGGGTLVTNWDGDDEAALSVDLNGDGDMLDDGPAIATSQIDLDQDGTPDVLEADGEIGFDTDTEVVGLEIGLDLNGDATVNGADSPGYPFFIAGLAGHRPPTPVLDMVDTDGDGVVEDGGLPRHIITTAPALGTTHTQHQTRLDFNKELENVGYGVIPEAGTAAEAVAMDFHAARWHETYLPDGTPVNAGNPDTRRIGEDGDVGPVGAEPTIPLEGFETNGLPAQQGAPYADPCRTDPNATTGEIAPVSETRRYKGANIQMDMTLNKVGWHFQQQRFEALWEDVGAMLTEQKAPEPLVMRLNPTECAEFWHTNLVPNVYELDDYQVKTPTDIIGQHIHLVKFDVTSADGSANGWNYEDGTLSPQEVEERIHAIHTNAAGSCGAGFVDANGDRRLDPGDVATEECPLARAHPYFKDVAGVGDLAWGARTTAQRWYADPLLSQSWDRGLGTVFTHDHYGPSTHQQVGLYSTVLVEPMASQWRDPETGEMMGGIIGAGDNLYTAGGTEASDQGGLRLTPSSTPTVRQDGGPTSWRADILTPDPSKSHREFFMEFADFQHAYEAGGGAESTINNGDGVQIKSYADFFNAINPSVRQEPPQDLLADLFWLPNQCPGGVPRPCPEAISADDPGTYVVNYRNEPLGLRVFDPLTDTDPIAPGIQPGQTAGEAGDLARAFETRTDRAIADLNTVQGQIPYPLLTAGVLPGDPATPLARVYQGDKVRFRVQTGAHEEEHNMTIHGLKWRQEEHGADSGWRNSQFMGISEYFNIEMPVVPDIGPGNPASLDYMWTMGAQTEDLWNGVWGILRSYGKARNDLLPLPSNDFSAAGAPTITNIGEFTPPGRGRAQTQPRVCPNVAPNRFIRVTAVRAADLFGPDGLVYNTRTNGVTDPITGLEQGSGPLVDPTALMYVRNDDLTYDAAGKPNGLKPGVPVEPLILRANAGDCIEVELTNALPDVVPNLPGFSALPAIVAKDKNVFKSGVRGITTFNANDLTPSSLVGLHPQLVAYNVRDSDGFLTGSQSGEVGNMQLVPPGASKKYTWYAGDIGVTNNPDGTVTLVPNPVEFGVVNLMPADRITGSNKGLVGAMVIEPQDATWVEDADSRASATVTHQWAGGTETAFREFVTILQNDINMRYGGGCLGVAAVMDCAVPNVAAEGGGVPEDPQDSGQKAINYGTEPLWFRLGIAPNTPFEHANLRGATQFDLFSNSRIGGDPQTPVFTVSTEPFTDVDGDGLPDAMQFRMRVVEPGGHARGHVFTLNGHAWQREPYVNDSASIGDDFRTHNHLDLSAATHNVDGPAHNMKSWWVGAQEGIGAGSHFDFVPRKTGGMFAVPGDYLFSDYASFGRFQGLWGIVRFADAPLPPANEPPEAVDDAFDAKAWTRRNPQPTNVAAPGVLGNDSDLEVDPMTAVLVTDATYGTVTLNADGSFTYLPTEEGFIGLDAFTYQVSDGSSLSNIATVTLDVK